MGINPLDFCQYVIRPTLEKLDRWTPALENLLLGTAAQASQLGRNLNSQGGQGLYRISAELHRQVWDQFLAFDPELASIVRGFASQREFLSNPDRELAINLAYATAIAWAVYAWRGAEIPTAADDGEAMAHCWYQYFDHAPDLSPDDFLRHYRTLRARPMPAEAAA
ncbi:MAG: hypothetical protein SV765_01190 [Pseudomonadota bacterium]|nr:hypothetical protein [Pseudomonadales bacterium]MDY6918807.1 hypothetical protein [Pseudomonadota bacterium]